MPSRFIRHLVVIVATLLALTQVDAWLSDDGTVGNRRRYLRAAEKRLHENPQATIAYFGQSTIDQWLNRGTLARTLDVPTHAVVNQHIGSCHPGCTFAQTRKLLAEGRRFEQVYFGVNLYALCEAPMPGRVLMHAELLPADEVVTLVPHYLGAEKPLAYLGQLVGVSISGAYAAGGGVRHHLRDVLGLPQPKARKHQHQWARAERRGSMWMPTCDFERDDLTLKTGFVVETLRNLTALSDRVFYLALPDRTLDEPEVRTQWPALLERHRAEVERVDGVVFIDLITDGVRGARFFRDGVHLNRRGQTAQAKLLEQKLREAGAL